MQLEKLFLAENQLVGSLPEAWSDFTYVSPYHRIDVMM